MEHSLADGLMKRKLDEAAYERQTVDTQAVKSGGSRVRIHPEAELWWKRKFLETSCASGARWQRSRDFLGLQSGVLFVHHFVSLDLSELPRHHKNFKSGEFRYTSHIEDVVTLCMLRTASYQGKAGWPWALLSYAHTYLSSALGSTDKKLGKWADWEQKQTSPQPEWWGNRISGVHCRTPPGVSLSAWLTEPGPQLRNLRPGHQLDVTSSLLQMRNPNLWYFWKINQLLLVVLTTQNHWWSTRQSEMVHVWFPATLNCKMYGLIGSNRKSWGLRGESSLKSLQITAISRERIPHKENPGISG